MRLKKVLVTGGTGYIGSHTCVALLESGYDVVVLDNLCNSSKRVLHRIQDITGKSLQFFKGDVRNPVDLAKAFEVGPDVVIHVAGLKSAAESIQKPLEYFDNNVSGTVTLLHAMHRYGVHHLVFSSSVAVYGESASVVVTEDTTLRPIHPYGRSKLSAEYLIRDHCQATPEMRAIVLRYANPVGAHPSGKIGEDPTGTPNNVMPYLAQVAEGSREKLQIYGGDYPTPDGTCVRDYIHVMDVASAHTRALEYGTTTEGVSTFNISTGHGYSVLELVTAYERASGRDIQLEIVGRREGDVPRLQVSPAFTTKELEWNATRDLITMCQDSWRWQTMNPTGYGGC